MARQNEGERRARPAATSCCMRPAHRPTSVWASSMRSNLGLRRRPGQRSGCRSRTDHDLVRLDRL